MTEKIITLRQVWQHYQDIRKLKVKSWKNHEQRIRLYLTDWLDLPIETITKQQVQERHAEISDVAPQMANDVMRTLRALLNFAMAKYDKADGSPLVKANPVISLSQVRAWNREHRRRGVIRSRHLGAWLNGVNLLHPTLRDYFLMLLFTGMRSSEVRLLTWNRCDLEAGVIHLENTKNGYDHTVVLSSFVWELLKIRKQEFAGPYVFPRIKGSSRTTEDMPFSCNNGYQRVIDFSGVKFMPHDCRRTYLTIGDELGIKNEVLKALVNHRSRSVTERYTVRSIERLRKATQAITDAILTHAGISVDKPLAVIERSHEEPCPYDFAAAIVDVVGAREGLILLIEDLHTLVCRQEHIAFEPFISIVEKLCSEEWLCSMPMKNGLTGITCGDKLRVSHRTGRLRIAEA